MPFVHKIVHDKTVIAIWRIDEIAEELYNQTKLTQEEIIVYNSFKSEKRKTEWLAWRVLLRHIYDGNELTIKYNKVGAPYINNSKLHISVSHCNGYVAIMISDKICGIDIENSLRSFEKTKTRFISPQEEIIVKEIDNYCCVVWCAKEACYKAYGAEGVDFIDNIQIKYIDHENLESLIFDTKIKLRHLRYEDLCIVFTV